MMKSKKTRIYRRDAEKAYERKKLFSVPPRLRGENMTF